MASSVEAVVKNTTLAKTPHHAFNNRPLQSYFVHYRVVAP